MSKVIIPDGYRPALSLYDTQRAIGMVKRLLPTRCARRSICTVFPRRFFWRLPPA